MIINVRIVHENALCWLGDYLQGDVVIDQGCITRNFGCAGPGRSREPGGNKIQVPQSIETSQTRERWMWAGHAMERSHLAKTTGRFLRLSKRLRCAQFHLAQWTNRVAAIDVCPCTTLILNVSVLELSFQFKSDAERNLIMQWFLLWEPDAVVPSNFDFRCQVSLIPSSDSFQVL
jgi:hypothetical protein